ncbi:MAG: SRPBCC domain-containing protein [Acidobacteriota bacterium]|jgi:uncharacterized protein YndB with AHSA1/START domain
MSDVPKTKTVDLTIEIDAPPEAVWQAIANAEELARWFPLNAEIEPGVGGTVTIDWGPDVAGTGDIDVWEEGRRLRYVERPWGEPGDEEPVQVAVEYTIEARGGKTVLRMVNSGFSADADWAEYLDTIDSGWRYFLLNLKHYLEHHRGRPRRMVWQRRKISIPKAEAWPVVFGSGGLASVSLPAQEGDTVHLWSGHEATVVMAAPPIHFACRCADLNDALLFVELEPGEPPYSMGVWLSLYGVDEEQAQALEQSLGRVAKKLAAIDT